MTKPNEPSMGDKAEEYELYRELYRGHARDEFRRLKEELDEYKGLYDAEYCQRQAYVTEAVKAEGLVKAAIARAGLRGAIASESEK